MKQLKNKDLKRRIIELLYKYKFSHIGSCLTAVDIIDEIYAQKKSDEKFVLSSGHAGLALYCVLEKYLGKDAEEIWNHHGTHPDRCEVCHLDCSSGSLGHGLGIAVGMALADRTKNVYCLISDGECAEGSIWEALQVMRDNKLDNLIIRVNINGYSAYKEINAESYLLERLMGYGVKIIFTDVEHFPTWLQGQQGHYVVMNERQYEQAMQLLK